MATYNLLVGVVVLHELAVGLVVLAFALRIARRRANVSSTTTARVSDLNIVSTLSGVSIQSF